MASATPSRQILPQRLKHSKIYRRVEYASRIPSSNDFGEGSLVAMDGRPCASSDVAVRDGAEYPGQPAASASYERANMADIAADSGNTGDRGCDPSMGTV